MTLQEALYRLEWEAEQGTLDLGRYRPSYVRWGKGSPLVFIHGLGDAWPSFVHPLALLAADYQCIAYDQPRGPKDRARLRGYEHDHLVEDLIRLLDHFGLPTATLIAHSFGTTIALKALHRHPERVARAVLVGSFAHRPLRPHERTLAWIGRYLPGTMRLVPGRRKAMQRAHLAAFSERTPDVWEHFLQRTALPPCRAMAHWAFVLDRTDLTPLLPAIRQPVLIVGGEWDPITPPRLQHQLFERLPNAVLLLLDRCGHFPMYTHPEALVDAIRKFTKAPACALPTPIPSGDAWPETP
jgi:pimeloyl-ACP methyl ester carboxylesterase